MGQKKMDPGEIKKEKKKRYGPKETKEKEKGEDQVNLIWALTMLGPI